MEGKEHILHILAIIFTMALLSAFVLLFTESSFAAGQGKPQGYSPAKYKEGEILVKFTSKAKKEKKENIHKANGAVEIKDFQRLNIHHVKIKKGMSVEEAVNQYQADPDVEYAEPNFELTVDGYPNDFYHLNLWGMSRIQAPLAWDITTGDPQIVVAVIDSGIDYTHPDLAGNMWVNAAEYYGVSGIDDDGNGWVDDIYGIDAYNNDSNPMDDNAHGTHVAGTIGAIGNNDLGVVGVNWKVRLMALKFLSSSGSGYTSNAITCLEYIRSMKDRGVNIVVSNNSWGGSGYSQALSDAIANQSDIIFAAAAGNSAVNNDLTPHYPASYQLDHIISVAATDQNDNLAYFSNWGSQSVDIAAPGQSIVSTVLQGDYSAFSGTSMATPHVAGLVALLKAQQPNLSALNLKKIILDSGDLLPAVNLGKTSTDKRINAFNSMHLASEEPPVADAGADMIVNEESTVILDGSGSYDPDGTISSYQWTQRAGVTVTLSDPAAAAPSFTAPSTGPGGEDLTFELTVVDDSGLSKSDEVNVQVAWVNDFPTYTRASIITYMNTQSKGITPEVTDPDSGDSHTFAIITQPAHGRAEVIDNQLYYMPDLDFLGADSFLFSATDLGNLDVQGTAEVSVQDTIQDDFSQLLIHSDTFEGDTNFYDSSAYGHEILATHFDAHTEGEIKHTTEVQNFGSSSIAYDYQEYLIINATNWNFTKEEFTIDFWFMNNSTEINSDMAYCTHMVSQDYHPSGSAGSYYNGIRYWSNTDTINVMWHNRIINEPLPTYIFEIGKWYHIAMIKSGYIGKLFVNGIQQGYDFDMAGITFLDNDTISLFAHNGFLSNPPYYIDEIHISKKALWTENFTPPTVPYRSAPNDPPVADAGPDQTVMENTLATLNGSNSTDPDNGIDHYRWTQAEGTPVILSDPVAVTPPFVTPVVTQPVNLAFQLVVTDRAGRQSVDSVNILVENALNLPPAMSLIGNKTVKEGEQLSFIIIATDPENGSLTFSASNLPPGATFDVVSRTFRWTPTFFQSGLYSNIRFEVSDGEDSDFEEISITVDNVNRIPVLGAIGNKTVMEGETLSFIIAATDADGDNLSYTGSNLPLGAVFDPQTKTFTWTPTLEQAGVYNNIRFEVSDGKDVDFEVVSITVLQFNQAPVLAPVGNKTVIEGTALTITLTASDPDGDTVTFSAVGLPIGSVLNPQTGVFNWTAVKGKGKNGAQYTLTFTANDGNLSDSETITITVGAAAGGGKPGNGGGKGK